ncbi:MAG: hypothetical protein HYT83_03760 [Candidatus Levybacteria bacterium]|nr:hypothetical protein [Candidatus Levybacteria bacterium]
MVITFILFFILILGIDLLFFSLSYLYSMYKKEQEKRKTIEDYKQENLIRIGKEQFTKLLNKGLTIPIGML